MNEVEKRGIFHRECKGLKDCFNEVEGEIEGLSSEVQVLILGLKRIR